jgi:hypothetical protein
VYRGSGIGKASGMDLTRVEIPIGGTPITKRPVLILKKGRPRESCCGCKIPDRELEEPFSSSG